MTAVRPPAPTPAPPDEERSRPRAHPPTQWQRIEHHSRTLDRAIRITQMADAKVAPVLALHVSLAAVSVTQSSGLGNLLFADRHSPAMAALGWLLLTAYGLASATAAFYVTAVYVPTAPRRGASRTHEHSLFYFDDIQAMPIAEFEERSLEFDIEVAERDVIRQAHTVSKIASDKLLGVQRAYLFSAATLLAWLPLMVLQRV